MNGSRTPPWVDRSRCSKAAERRRGVEPPIILSLGNKHTLMSFTNKPTVALSVDQVIDLVDQLSPADKLKVAKRIQKGQRSKDIDRLVEIFSKVKISEKQLTAMVEKERAKIHAREQARPARR